MLTARVPTPWNSSEPPKAQIVGVETGRYRYHPEPKGKVFFRLEERRPDIEFICDSQYSQFDGNPLELIAPEVKQRKRVFIPFGDRSWDLQALPPTIQIADILEREEFVRLRAKPKRHVFFFENRPIDFGEILDSFQDVVGVWDYEPWKLLKRAKQRIYFKFENRRWAVAFEKELQVGSWEIKSKTWYVLSDEDYFPASLRKWLRGRCFMMVRLRSGAGQAGAETPANGYVTEDGVIFYVAEDGSTFYVQET